MRRYWLLIDYIRPFSPFSPCISNHPYEQIRPLVIRMGITDWFRVFVIPRQGVSSQAAQCLFYGRSSAGRIESYPKATQLQMSFELS